MNNLSYNKSLLSSLPAVHKIQKLPEVQEMISNLGNSLVLSKIREVQKDLREALTSENEINKIASERDKNKFLIKYFVPFMKRRDFPVNKTLNLSGGNILFILI